MKHLGIILIGVTILLFFLDPESTQRRRIELEQAWEIGKGAPPSSQYDNAESSEKEPNVEISSADFIFPLKNKSVVDIISFYGDDRANGRRKHKGIDIPDDKGAPVLAVGDGKILKVTNKGNAGKQIWLKSGNLTFFYAHLNSWLVQSGQQVKQGDIIGTVGNTGNAQHTLPHLHFEVIDENKKTIDPVTLYNGNRTDSENEI